MSLLCSTSAAIEAIKAKKEALENVLNGSLSSLQSSISGAMNDLKSSIGNAGGSIPVIRDFKAELVALKNKTGIELIRAREALNATWGGAVNDLTSLMDAVMSPDFSPCSEAPNVKGEVKEDGTVETVVVAQETPAPSGPPEKPAPAPAIVADKSVQPSSTGSGISVTTSNSDYALYKSTVAEALKELTDRIASIRTEVKTIEGTEDFQVANGSKSFLVDLTTPEARLRKGQITQAQYGVWKDWEKKKAVLIRNNQILTKLNSSFSAWELLRAGRGSSTELHLRQMDSVDGGNSGEWESLFKKPESITETFKSTIATYYRTTSR